MTKLYLFLLFLISGLFSLLFGFLLSKTDLILNQESLFFRESYRILSVFLLFSMLIMEIAWTLLLGFTIYDFFKPFLKML